MNMYTNTKKSKKFILVLVLLILFNFFYPKQVKAIDFMGNISSFIFFLERGVLGFLNNMFCDEKHDFELTEFGETKIFFTPENIIKGKFILFNANIFKDLTSDISPSDSTGSADDKYYDMGHDWLVGSDGARATLRNVISGWYYNLFNFSIVALLSVLVYVGIRMITSTISQDKAKYKIMFKDWLVAICLLIVMHYIMIGVLNITNMITEAIGSSGNGANETSRIMTIIYNINKDENGSWWTANCKDSIDQITGQEIKGGVAGCRYHTYEDGKVKHYTMMDAFAYEFLLIGIVVLTFIFAWKYLKREFTVIFLILLGPISCVTYPIDKISDGKAQAFNKWLTEFIYNILIQPFHLLLYVVLVGSAVELSNENVLYGLACLAMIIPAEKFVKEMFGFKDKLGSPLGAMATGAVASQLLSKAKGSGGKSGGNGNEGTQNGLPPKTVDEKDLNEDNGSPTNSSSGIRENEQIENTGNDSDSRQMLDAYDEKYNTEEWDPQERDAMAREANTEQGMNYTDDEYENILRDSGYSDEEIAELMGQNTDQNQQEDVPNSQEDIDEDLENSADKPKRNIKSMAKGVLATGKDVGSKLINRHSARMAAKWGSTNRGQRWINRGKKVGKMALKGAGGLAGAAVGASIGLLSGKGIAGGALAGATLTGRAMDKIASVGGDYIDALRTPEQREDSAFNKFRADKGQQDKARLNFIDNHGVEPSSKQLDDEMRDRFELSRAGLSDSQIDDAVGTYQKLKNNPDFTEKQALTQAVIASQYADRYKGKFEKESDMKGALSALTERLSKNGYGGDAELKAREILDQAATMKKETIQLPKERITIPSSAQTNSRSQVEIDVQEGQIEVARNRETSTREIDARINFRENRVNNNVLNESNNDSIEYKVNADTSRVRGQIDRVSMNRQNTKRKGNRDERVENIQMQEKVDNDLDVKAAKKSTEEKGKRQLGSKKIEDN